MDLRHRLQQSTGTGGTSTSCGTSTDIGFGTGTTCGIGISAGCGIGTFGTGTGIGIGCGTGTYYVIGIGIGCGIGYGTSTGTCTGAGVQDVEYCLKVDGLVRFRDRIYVSNDGELKKVILREFHAKPYSGHPSYQKTLIAVKKFYYWRNLRRDVEEIVARCLDCQHVKAKLIQVDIGGLPPIPFGPATSILSVFQLQHNLLFLVGLESCTPGAFLGH